MGFKNYFWFWNDINNEKWNIWVNGLLKGLLLSVNFPFQELWRTELCAWSHGVYVVLWGLIHMNLLIESEITRCGLAGQIFEAGSSVYQLHSIHAVPQQPAGEVCSPHLTQCSGLGRLQVRRVDHNHADALCDRGFSFAIVRLFVAALKSIWTINGCSWMWRNSTWSFLEH